jgi:uroporphyrinogen decarboxylase
LRIEFKQRTGDKKQKGKCMAKTMTHRERLLAAISHEQPDMVPIDLGGTVDSSVVVEGYGKLKEHFGIQAENVLYHRMMRVVQVDERILRALDIDTRGIFLGAPMKGGDQELGPGRYRDVWGVERVHPEHSYYYDQLDFPLSGDITISHISSYPWPDPDDPGLVQGLKDRVKWIREHTDCAAVLPLPAPCVHTSQYLRGFEDWFCDFVTNPRILEALLDAVLEVTLQMAKNELKEVGQEVDAIICADDLGTQQGLQISYDHFLKYIKPRLEKYLRQVHDLSPAKVLFHSCGSVASIIEDLIEIGVDALNPVQVTAADMNPVELKRKFRGRMAFWGGMDSQNTLPKGSVKDVKKMVEDLIEQMGEGGGFVLSAVHNIQPDVPLDNILAMFQHAREYVPSFAK